jgi:hypothetical protein
VEFLPWVINGRVALATATLMISISCERARRRRTAAIETMPLALAPAPRQSGAQKHVEHVCSRAADHVRERVPVELEEKGSLGAVKCQFQ